MKLKNRFSGQEGIAPLAFILLVGLPIFVWAIVTGRFNIFPRAATGEPTPMPVVINETFTGNGPMDPSSWNWSGSSGSNALLESDKLKQTVASGSDGVGGNDVTTQALINFQIAQVSGDFETKVDFDGITNGSGWQELRFTPGASIAVRRNKTAAGELLELWTGTGSLLDTKNRSMNIPAGTGTIHIKMVRKGSEMIVDYDLGNGFTSFIDMSMNGLLGTGALPRLGTENNNPDYTSVASYFDNYIASGNNIFVPTPYPTPTSYPTPTPKPTPTSSPTSNSTPVITTRSIPNAHKNRFYRVKIDGTDADISDSLSIEFSGLPDWLKQGVCQQNINTSPKIVSCFLEGMPNVKFVKYTFKVSISDNHGASTTKNFTFWVLPY